MGSGAEPVYEHYHGGLQDHVHVLHVTLDSAGDAIRWARAHDTEMQSLVANANEYMSGFEQLTQCYIWRLLEQYGKLLRYSPDESQTATFGSDVSVRTVKVHRRPLRKEAMAFKI